MKQFSRMLPAAAALIAAVIISCSDGSSGGSGDNSENQTARPGNTVYETASVETEAGNKVSDTIRLYADNTFDLLKTASYEDSEGTVRVPAVFYKGTYSGDIISGLTFNVTEQIDESKFDSTVQTAFGLKSSAPRSARAARTAQDIREMLSACQNLIKTIALIPAEKTLHYSSSDLTEAKRIDLRGFLLTGDNCTTPTPELTWAETEAEGAIPLKEIQDGVYQCEFVATKLATELNILKLHLIKEHWAKDYGYSDIDIKNAVLPRDVQIIKDSEKYSGQWFNPEQILLVSMNQFSTYTVQLDTAAVPGIIQIKVTESSKKSLSDIIDLKNIYTANWSDETKCNFSSSAASGKIKVKPKTFYHICSIKPFDFLTKDQFIVRDDKNIFSAEDGIFVNGAEECYLVFSWADENHIAIDVNKED